MTTNYRSGHGRDDREDRIDELKQHAEKAAKGELIAWESDILSPEEKEQFWQQVVEYADEMWRQEWLADFPDYVMPAHEDPPHERDRYLPKPYEAPPSQ